MKITTDMKLIGGAVVLVGIAAWWFTRKGSAASVGNAIGGAAVDLITGTIGGVATGVATAANDPSINPLQPVGVWLGGTVYDLTHSKQNGGIW